MRTRHHSATLPALLIIVGLTAGGRAQASKRTPLAPSPAGWKQAAYIKASNPSEGDQFGYSVALSRDGNTLAVGAIGEDSNATGINGDQANNSANGSGAVYVFTRSGSTWSQQAYVKSSNTRPNVMFGYSVAVNGNGDTLAVGEFDADRGRGALYTFGRSDGTWSQQARLQPKLLSPQDSMGCWVAISDDGNTVVAGALDEDSLTTGINAVEGGHSGVVDGPDDNSSGAVFGFVRTGTTWSEQVNFKASNSGKHDWFGIRLALSGDGNTFAAGAPNEDSAGQGINGKQDDNSADEAGAAYVYTRSGATWTFRDYMKGAKNAKFDEFGSAVALNRDGRVLAVGAHFESGGARGVNGNQPDKPIPRSGAVYVFTR